MADKKTRNIKVCRQPGYNRKPAPEIKLSGQWLREVGFEIGDPVRVECEDGKLVVILDRERAEEMEAQKAFMEEETKKLKARFDAEKKEIYARFVAERKAQYGA